MNKVIMAMAASVMMFAGVGYAGIGIDFNRFGFTIKGPGDGYSVLVVIDGNEMREFDTSQRLYQDSLARACGKAVCKADIYAVDQVDGDRILLADLTYNRGGYLISRQAHIAPFYFREQVQGKILHLFFDRITPVN